LATKQLPAFRLGAICLLLWAVSAATVSAAPLDLSSLRGRVVYLDFWASWCGPCRQSFPWMESMKKAYEAQGLTVLAINVDHDRADADRFLKIFNPDFEIRFDPQGSSAEEFKVSGMPTSVIIDRHGVVRFTHVGFWPAQGEVSAQQIQKLLAEH
jgi:thiol-disulfide isomerase/thioredoxin